MFLFSFVSVLGVIHACCDHCTNPYPWPHFGQTRTLTTRRINLLTATLQSEIKSNDPWYRPMMNLLYSGTPVMRPQLLPHKNGHMRGVVVCQGHELF